jgi:hypothetical protein
MSAFASFWCVSWSHFTSELELYKGQITALTSELLSHMNGVRGGIRTRARDFVSNLTLFSRVPVHVETVGNSTYDDDNEDNGSEYSTTELPALKMVRGDGFEPPLLAYHRLTSKLAHFELVLLS